MATAAGADPAALAREVAELSWYHTLELPGGIVTPGYFDTRPALRKVPLPASLEGKRCLDVGTWDGFWAFEMERRGAAEVTAIDLDDPTRWDWPWPRSELHIRVLDAHKQRNKAFHVAHRALGSKVQRHELSVYDLSPEAVGTFDFVFMGTLLLHLRDPVRALNAVRSVVRGELLSADAVSLALTLLRPRKPLAILDTMPRPWWWTPNLAAQRSFVRRAGFEIVEAGGPYFLRYGPAHPCPPLSRPREWLRHRVLPGYPHGWVLARPKEG